MLKDYIFQSAMQVMEECKADWFSVSKNARIGYCDGVKFSTGEIVCTNKIHAPKPVTAISFATFTHEAFHAQDIKRREMELPTYILEYDACKYSEVQADRFGIDLPASVKLDNRAYVAKEIAKYITSILGGSMQLSEFMKVWDSIPSEIRGYVAGLVKYNPVTQSVSGGITPQQWITAKNNKTK